MRRAFFAPRAVQRVPVASRWLRIGLVVFAIGSASACSVPSSPDPDPRPGTGQTPLPTATAANLIEATNAERARAGVPALALNGRLMAAAQIQAEQVAAAGRLEHTIAEARLPSLEDRVAAAGYDWQYVGENLAFGQRDAAHAVDTWMQSPSHRSNIMSALFSEVGAGYVVDPTGRPYYVQVFGTPR